MIKTKRLREIIYKIETFKKEAPFEINVGILLNCILLEIGVKPKVIPRLTLYKVAKECTDGRLDYDSLPLRCAYYNDLSLICSLVKGILANYSSYKPKGVLYTLTEKVLTTAVSKLVQCSGSINF